MLERMRARRGGSPPGIVVAVATVVGLLLARAPMARAEPTPECQPFTVVIRQFDEVDGKYVEILTPKNAVSYADSRQRALAAPEDDEEAWLAKGGDPDWRNGEAHE